MLFFLRPDWTTSLSVDGEKQQDHPRGPPPGWLLDSLLDASSNY